MFPSSLPLAVMVLLLDFSSCCYPEIPSDKMNDTPQWHNHRLPNYTVPIGYFLTLQPYFEEDEFYGSVDILVDLKQPSDVFILHVVELNLTETRVSSNGNGSRINHTVIPYEPNDFVVLKLAEKADIGEYILYFEFNGKFNKKLIGLYKSSYVDPASEEKRYLVSTHFEPISARRVFPCFDEPAFRARFRITIKHSSKYFALSNTPVKKTVDLGNNIVETKFGETEHMSTYLVAIVVCNFTYKEEITKNGVQLRLYAAEHNIDKGNYALEIGNKLLTYFEEYIKIPYREHWPLKKLDFVAVPNFKSAGMENWGLIIFKDTSLLWDEHSSVLEKVKIAHVVAHELAHMWFGNLVHMNWWDDVWLKEGFATYMATKAVQKIEPEMKAEDKFVTASLYSALKQDSSINSHPIVQRFSTIKEAKSLYDTITYSKGAVVLRMLENYMGDDFLYGVGGYLRKFAFKTSRTEDLWLELTAATEDRLNISAIMDPWIRQMNFPYLNVKRQGNTFHIEQHRFLLDPASAAKGNSSIYGYEWQIPISYRTAESSAVHHFLMNTSTIDRSLPNSEWIKFNVNATGMYLVNYERSEWDTFSRILETNHSVFSETDRANFLIDSLILSKSGNLDDEVPLSLTQYLKRETSPVVWQVGIDILYGIEYRYRKHRNRKLIRKYSRSLMKDILQAYGWEENGDFSERKLRSELLGIACYVGERNCLKTAGELFRQWMSTGNLPQYIREPSIVFSYGIQVNVDEGSWNHVWQSYLNESDPKRKQDLLRAVSNAQKELLLRRLIDYASDENNVKSTDYFKLLRYMAQNKKGYSVVYSHVTKNWVNLYKRYEIGLENFASYLFRYLSSENDLKVVERFYKNHPNLEAQNTRTETIKAMNNNVNWFQKHGEGVERWLRQKLGES